MVGPALTLASTGSLYHAGVSFGANKAVEKETGMTTTELVSTVIDEEKRDKKKFNKKLITLVNENLEKTRQEILIKSNKKN